MWKFIKTYPKLSLSLLVLLWSGAYVLALRAPQAVDCFIHSVVRQTVPWDKWRYNLIVDECQYDNGTRWIPLQKVMDVGAGDVDEVEDIH